MAWVGRKAELCFGPPGEGRCECCLGIVGLDDLQGVECDEDVAGGLRLDAGGDLEE
jgi:hypothetical protein